MNFVRSALLFFSLSTTTLSLFADTEDSFCLDCVKEARKARESLRDCSIELNERIDRLSCDIENAFPCATPIVIDAVPVVLDTPGRYCVVNDLEFEGSGPAISIVVSNVLIDFDNHVLTIDAADAQGIFAQDVDNIIVQNGTIQSDLPATDDENRAIYLVNVKHSVIQNMALTDTLIGVGTGQFMPNDLTGVEDLTIYKCFFNHASQNARGTHFVNSSGITVDSCVFGNIGPSGEVSAIGIFAETNTQNTTITNCQFLNNNQSSGRGIEIQGFVFAPAGGPSVSTIIDGCTFSNTVNDIAFFEDNGAPVDALITNCTSADSQLALILTGRGFYIENYVASQKISPLSLQLAEVGFNTFTGNDVTFKNCNFTSPLAQASATVINISNGDGILIDDCIINSNGTGDNANPASNIAIGSTTFAVKNVKVRNCILKGNTQYSIIAKTANISAITHLFIEDCLIDGAQDAGIFLDNTVGAVIRDCQICNVTGNVQRVAPGHGIHINDNSFSNSVRGCVISRNNGDGIFVDNGSDLNVVTYNKVFNNRQNGIECLNPLDNQFYYNEACNNAIVDCVGLIFTGAPGATSFKLGQNICCVSS